MAYRTDSELSQGCELLLGRLDFLGGGMSAEELFPELADEEERVGINNKDYDERINSVGFLNCVDGLNPDILMFDEDLGIENELIELIDDSKNSELVKMFMSELADSEIRRVDSKNIRHEHVPGLFISEDYRSAKELRKRNSRVLLITKSGAAVFL